MSRKSHTSPAKHHDSPMVKRTKTVVWWSFLALLLYLPFHFFLAQWLSLHIGSLDGWKIGKDVVILTAAVLAAYLLLRELKATKSKELKLLAWLTGGYAVVHLLFLIFGNLDGESSVLATLYNNRLLMLMAIGLVVGMSTYGNTKTTDLIVEVVISISSLVAVLGLMQLFLPNDFLADFGYTLERGARAFFGIDSKEDLPRIIATVRDPNSLGAYLIITLSLLIALANKPRKNLKNLSLWATALIPLQAAAVLFTFSRSAWLGVMVAAGFILWQVPRFRRLFTTKNLILTGVFLVFLGLAAYPSIRESYVLENVVFHSDESTIEESSTEKHLSRVIDGTVEAIKQPFGHGPGTAGIVSIRNEEVTLTENYYVQIFYEVGIIGIAIFVALNVWAYKMLLSSPDTALRLALLASFWGLIVTNMLLHSWSNEVVIIWWLLAGYQIGLSKTFD